MNNKHARQDIYEKYMGKAEDIYKSKVEEEVKAPASSGDGFDIHQYSE